MEVVSSGDFTIGLCAKEIHACTVYMHFMKHYNYTLIFHT